MKRLWRLVVVLSLSALALAVDQAKESKAADRVQASADVLNEIQSAPDSGVPQEILSRAECVAVVPSMLKGGFIVGAKYGRGVASCRTPKATPIGRCARRCSLTRGLGEFLPERH